MTFKNQTRYNLDKTPSKATKHTQVWQKKTKCPNYIKYPNQNMSEDTTLKRYQWNQDTKWWKYHQGINQTLYTFHDGTSTKTKNVCLPRRHVIGIKYQMKTTNVQKAYRIAPPRCVHYLRFCIWIQKCTQMRSSLSI